MYDISQVPGSAATCGTWSTRTMILRRIRGSAPSNTLLVRRPESRVARRPVKPFFCFPGGSEMNQSSLETTEGVDHLERGRRHYERWPHKTSQLRRCTAAPTRAFENSGNLIHFRSTWRNHFHSLFFIDTDFECNARCEKQTFRDSQYSSRTLAVASKNRRIRGYRLCVVATVPVERREHPNPSFLVQDMATYRLGPEGLL